MAFEHLCTGAIRALRSAIAAGLFLSLALAGFLIGCKSSKGGSANASSTLVITGKLTYTRIPLLVDGNGVPTGLETVPANFKVLPLRGASVIAFQGTDETNPDGTKTRVWKKVNGATSDLTGSYTMTVNSGPDTFLEVQSVFQSGNLQFRIIADPAGVNSSLPQADRVVYTARKGLDGTSPAGNPTPGTPASTATSVNFDLGINDKFWLTPSNLSNDLTPASATLESNGTGSRAFAIGDTILSFGAAYMDSASTASGMADLHYRPGISDARGSFIEFDRTKYPLAYSPTDGNTHYFGSIKGSSADDDAWDEGVILPIVSRFYLYTQGPTLLFPPAVPLADLSPDVALIEGLAPAMAANLLKSPYLANTTASGVQITDVRDITGLPTAKQTVYSAPNLRALTWELALKANSQASPGTSASWSLINPSAMKRFFVLLAPLDRTDISNFYLQLGRLKESRGATDPVDLAAIFTDPTLTSITAPFGIAWPRPTTPPLNLFVADWGADPNSASVAALPLSMANAVMVPELIQGSLQTAFPNVSEGEVAYARFTLSKDTAFNLNVTSSTGPLPAGSRIQIRFLSTGLVYTFNGDASAPAVRVILPGNSTTPVIYPVMVQLISPSTSLPDFTATVQMAAAN